MRTLKFKLLVVIICSCLGTPQATAAYKVNTSMIDGIKVQSATRVQAGKYFQVKLTSKVGKINGVCWLNWALSKGFAVPKDFKMTSGKASVKLLPIAPGAGEMDFYCGPKWGNAEIGGSSTIYIAP